MIQDKHTLHLVSNAHLDPVWQWQWEEGAVEALSTFRAALMLLEKFPEYVFVHNEALLYEWTEEYDPELFESIRKLVRAGRWVIVGGWYVQPDCNIPGGESFVRQALYGKQYFREKFGVEPCVAYNVDSFGHNGGLPQILLKSGYKYYIHFRPTSDDEKDLPRGPYIWRGVDGSEIVACRPALGHYCTDADQAADKARQGLDMIGRNGHDEVCFWGVGDHGGAASEKELRELRALIESAKTTDVFHSHPEAFLDAVTSNGAAFSVHEGDLQRCFTGCYTSGAYLKRSHRLAEGLLAQAERFATLAHYQTGMAYPKSEIEAAWKNLLFAQFHDILAGSSSEGGMRDGMELLSCCHVAAKKVRLRAALALAKVDPPDEEGIPVYVFNPHSFTYKGAVEADFMTDYRPDMSGNKLHFSLTDADGGTVAHQQEMPTSQLPAEWRKRIVFQAEVPPMAHARYMIKRAIKPETVNPGVSVSREGDSMVVNTGRLRASFDLNTGLMNGLTDLLENRQLLSDASVGLLVVDDQGDSWGSKVDSYGDIVGKFSKSDSASSVSESVRVIESGPVRTVIESELQFSKSTAVQRFVFYPDQPYFEIALNINWNEPRRMAKLSIPTSIHDAGVTCEVPYGAIERATDGDEYVGQRWTMLESNGYAIGLVNTGQYGFDARQGELRLSLLRSPAFCHEKNVVLDPKRAHSFMDIGVHEIRLAVVFGHVEQSRADVIRAANQLNIPAMVLPYFPAGPGSLPGPKTQTPQQPFVSISPETVVLGALKKAEDGNGYIVRVHESAGVETDTQLQSALADRCLAFKLGPYELKTFRIAQTGIEEMDLLEKPGCRQIEHCH